MIVWLFSRPNRALGKNLAGATGLEPAASCVTGRRSNQLNYAPAFTFKYFTFPSFPCPQIPKTYPECRDRAEVCWESQVAVKPASRRLECNPVLRNQLY